MRSPRHLARASCAAALLTAVAACGVGVESGTTISPPGPAPSGAPGAPAPGAERGTTYGTPSAEATPVALADLLARPAEFEGRVVRVEGTITDVCAKRGCWIRIGDDAVQETVTFKVEDGVMVFPMTARGGRVVADGTAHAVALDLERTRALLARRAEEAGRPFDPATVTEPLTTVRIDGLGAVVR